MNLRLPVLAVSFALLSGCAASVKRGSSDAPLLAMPPTASAKLVLNVTGSQASTSAGDWRDFKQEWSENFAEQAQAAGLPFEMQEGPAKATGQNGTLLTVDVKDYRFIRPGTRYAVGVMAGNAFIESTLTFSDLKTGAKFGTQTANTSSSAWEGIFSAMTNKQVEAIAKDAVAQVKGTK
jgi:hypothetical protein